MHSKQTRQEGTLASPWGRVWYSVVGEASAPAHSGMGMGRGMGAGRGTGSGAGRQARSSTPPALRPAAVTSREAEIADLQDMAGDLRKQLADVVERLDRLEKGD